MLGTNVDYFQTFLEKLVKQSAAFAEVYGPQQNARRFSHIRTRSDPLPQADIDRTLLSSFELFIKDQEAEIQTLKHKILELENTNAILLQNQQQAQNPPPNLENSGENASLVNDLLVQLTAAEKAVETEKQTNSLLHQEVARLTAGQQQQPRHDHLHCQLENDRLEAEVNHQKQKNEILQKQLENERQTVAMLTTQLSFKEVL